MKRILVSMLLISGLCSFKKDKKKAPEPAFKNSQFTVIAAYGLPSALWAKPTYRDPVTRGCALVGAEYQVERWFKAGLQYSYYHAGTGMQPVQDHFSGTPYQRDGWAREHGLFITADFCYLNKGKWSLSSGIGLGVLYTNYSTHTIDSVGISTYSKLSGVIGLDARLRLLNAQVRLKENLGLYGGLLVAPGASIAIGAHYTFSKRK